MAVLEGNIRIDEAMDLPPTVNLHLSAWIPCDSPQVGDVIENCKLVAELGHGGSGRVFLAQQPALADRFLVLKVTTLSHEEHLNLVRLQHTHIMPLYWASMHPYDGIRVLAMPYLAKTTLSVLLNRLRTTPIETWDGERVLAELERDQEGVPVQIPAQEHAAQVLRHSSWIQFVLYIGQTLAETLGYAHRRNLLHLDIKPSNILITPDGQPILLDMDVARQPIAAGTETVPFFGGTPAFMSPEQRAAMDALLINEPIPTQVDERSDVYSLGKVLYLALGGRLNANHKADPHGLPAINEQVTPELAEIVARCLADNPEDRYPNCYALAADLDRQRHDLPLRGVRDRLSERWRKWRRRRPLGLPLAMVFMSFCAAVGAASFSVQQINVERRVQAEAALVEGQELQRQGQYEAATRRFRAGAEIAAQTSGGRFLHLQLSHRLQNAQRLRDAQELNTTVSLMRFYALEERTSRRLQYGLEASGRKVWKKRIELTNRSAGSLEQSVERKIDSQLQESMLLWCDLRLQLAPPTHEDLVRGEISKVIAQAEELFGPTFAVQLARQQHGLASLTIQLEPDAAWEHGALGRLALSHGDLAKGTEHFRKAFELDPLDPMSHFYLGIAAKRHGVHAEAIQFFSYCLGAEPSPECLVLRGEAYAALGQKDNALRDFQHAIERKADMALAFRQRGHLYQAIGQNEDARRDLERARQLSE